MSRFFITGPNEETDVIPTLTPKGISAQAMFVIGDTGFIFILELLGRQ